MSVLERHHYRYPDFGEPPRQRRKRDTTLSLPVRFGQRERMPGIYTGRDRKKKRRLRGWRKRFVRRPRRYLRRRVRREIKRAFSNSNGVCGLYSTADQTVSGHLQFLPDDSNATATTTFTPRTSQGLGAVGHRIGDKIQVRAIYCRFRITTQTSYIGPTKLKIYIFTRPTDSVKANSSLDFLERDAMVSPAGYNILSTLSARTRDMYSQYRVLAVRDVYLDEDLGTAGTLVKDVEIKLKMNQTIQYDTGTNVVLRGDYGCIIVANNGNCALTVNTGVNIAFEQVMYYQDA